MRLAVKSSTTAIRRQNEEGVPEFSHGLLAGPCYAEQWRNATEQIGRELQLAAKPIGPAMHGGRAKQSTGP